MNLIENLKWRYATKKMNPSKKVSEKDIAEIKEAIQLSASSYGLQPYKILDIRDSELRQQLQPICWNQTQITDASHLFIFCNKIAVNEDDIDNHIKLNAEIKELEIEKLSAYGDFVKTKLKEKSQTEMFHWTEKQTYIALGNALSACAELKLDSSPMEGFDTNKVNELLKLSEEGLNACVMLAIGYRDEEDAASNSKKVRKPIDELFVDLA